MLFHGVQDVGEGWLALALSMWICFLKPVENNLIKHNKNMEVFIIRNTLENRNVPLYIYNCVCMYHHLSYKIQSKYLFGYFFLVSYIHSGKYFFNYVFVIGKLKMIQKNKKNSFQSFCGGAQHDVIYKIECCRLYFLRITASITK